MVEESKALLVGDGAEGVIGVDVFELNVKAGVGMLGTEVSDGSRPDV